MYLDVRFEGVNRESMPDSSDRFQLTPGHTLVLKPCTGHELEATCNLGLPEHFPAIPDRSRQADIDCTDTHVHLFFLFTNLRPHDALRLEFLTSKEHDANAYGAAKLIHFTNIHFTKIPKERAPFGFCLYMPLQ